MGMKKIKKVGLENPESPQNFDPIKPMMQASNGICLDETEKEVLADLWGKEEWTAGCEGKCRVYAWVRAKGPSGFISLCEKHAKFWRRIAESRRDELIAWEEYCEQDD